MTINQEDFHHWQQHGWLLVRQILDEDTMSSIHREINALASPAEEGGRSLHYYENSPAGPLLCRTERFLEDSKLLSDLILKGAIPETAGRILGEPVLLFKEKVNYKLPGGAGFAPHQDAAAYDFIDLHITCLLAVDSMTVENGCLEIAVQREHELVPMDDAGCVREDVAAGFEWVAMEMQPGDLLFFDSYAIHRSGPNQGSSARRAIYLTYNAASESDMRQSYYENRDRRMAADPAGRISTIGHFQGRSVNSNQQN